MKGLQVVREELKQRLIAKAAKINRYNDRIEQYRQNRLLCYDQSKFYVKLDKETTDEQVYPSPEESRELWSSIWVTAVIIKRMQSG